MRPHVSARRLVASPGRGHRPGSVPHTTTTIPTLPLWHCNTDVTLSLSLSLSLSLFDPCALDAPQEQACDHMRDIRMERIGRTFESTKNSSMRACRAVASIVSFHFGDVVPLIAEVFPMACEHEA
jgi:hypothetical protein